MKTFRFPLLVAMLAAPTMLAAQSNSQNGNESRVEAVGKSAGQIASQPARDVGASKKDIPPVLLAAQAAPYGLKGIKTCKNLSSAFHALNDVIGPDFAPGDAPKENRAGKLAEAGGKTIVNSILPFRGLVREISGAAPADRRFARAVAAGVARRGFLRGVHQARGCKTALM